MRRMNASMVCHPVRQCLGAPLLDGPVPDRVRERVRNVCEVTRVVGVEPARPQVYLGRAE